VKGRTFYNNSIDSSPYRTQATLSTFKDKVILIAGGKDKNNDYSIVAPAIVKHVKRLVLVGQTAHLIEKAVSEYAKKVGGGPEIRIFNDFEQAVTHAYETSSPGDNIVLSPASTSFDLFRNFEDRGRVFKEIVHRLSEC
jgi:UDP-N-acetylmuramoylalanine--D-glutamate ligase